MRPYTPRALACRVVALPDEPDGEAILEYEAGNRKVQMIIPASHLPRHVEAGSTLWVTVTSF